MHHKFPLSVLMDGNTSINLVISLTSWFGKSFIEIINILPYTIIDLEKKLNKIGKI